MPKYIDITRRLIEGTAVWPGDETYKFRKTLAIRDGKTVNLSTISLSAHTGSHIDAPYHFDEDGKTIDSLDLSVFWGAAQVVAVAKAAGPLYPQDISSYQPKIAPRLLLRSETSSLDQSIFPDEFVYPSPELVNYLESVGTTLLGTDSPSMDQTDSKSLAGHHALKRSSIAILEWLDLSAAAEGFYELVAMPLRIIGGDGSPVRAVLKTED